MNVIIGTAGHIDHGKTALIKALTGTDADRLPEEKQRGITIDLGFAELRLGDLDIGFVDVPGHERFVRNMLAGAGGIDLVLMIVAADEGVMPQTREHFEICRLLGTKAGIVVLTKSDLVDDEMMELVRLDVAELVEGSFLENAPVMAVSAKTGSGVDELKQAIASAASGLTARRGTKIGRLPIDRSFTIKGFGAVVTGTLLDGEVAEGEELELLPARRIVRVRGVQTQGRTVSSASAGQRTALNLGGIDHADISRGMVLAENGVIEPIQVIDTQLEVVAGASRPLRSRQRVRFHLGADEVLARVQVLSDAGEIEPGSSSFVQLRLERPVAALPGDRFILRSYSPQATIAGGVVLDAHAGRHRRRDLPAVTTYLEKIAAAKDDPAELCAIFIEVAGRAGLSLRSLRVRTGFTANAASAALGKLEAAGRVVNVDDHITSASALSHLRSETFAVIKSAAERDPLAGGITREELRDRLFRFVDPMNYRLVVSDLTSTGKIVAENEMFKPAGTAEQLSDKQREVRDILRQAYSPDGYEVPKLDDAIRDASAASGIPAAECRKIFQLLINSKEVVKVSAEFYFNRVAIERLTASLRERADKTEDRLIDVATIKELAGVSRKYAIPLLEYFDSARVTVRHGDKRRVI